MSELAEDDVEIAVEAAHAASAGGGAAAGRVARAGERAAALAGCRVLVGPIDPCGECDVCRRGGAAVCPLARRRDASPAPGATLVAAARWVVALGDGLELPLPGAAAVAGDVALAYTLYARTGVGAREPVVVVGADPIARFLVEILRAKGATPTVVVDPADAAWADWLIARGAALARAHAGGDLRATVAAALAAQDGAAAGGRPWRVIATSPAAVPTAASLAGPRATLTVRAAPGAPGAAGEPAALLELAAREVTILGVAGAHPDLVVEVAAMCVKGEIDLAGGTAAGAPHAARVSS